jgi:predicted MPP superfamily phosphohydrolase
MEQKKIIHFSDLHKDVFDRHHEDEQNTWLQKCAEDADIIVITGDIFESDNYNSRTFNPYEYMSKLFNNKIVICTMGNHEFYYKTPIQTREYYAKLYNPEKYNVHYLDIVGKFDIDYIRFVGNCLFYDGSMKTVHNQDIYDFANGNWADKYIREFDYEKENEYCIKQIDENLKNDTGRYRINVLCTHAVPHHKINGWYEMDRPVGNLFNAYSGNYDMLTERIHDIHAVLCGHTHKRIVMGINGIECYNPGNDYVPPYRNCQLFI